MKMPKVTIRPINKRTGTLPDDVADRNVLLIRAPKGRVEAQQVVHFYPTLGISAPGFTHYAILPIHL